jgi:hypothetical protein
MGLRGLLRYSLAFGNAPCWLWEILMDLETCHLPSASSITLGILEYRCVELAVEVMCKLTLWYLELCLSEGNSHKVDSSHENK